MLNYLSAQSPVALWLIFLLENAAVTGIALFAGWVVLKLNHKPVHLPSRTEVWVCMLTNLINTAVTYAGFWLWQHHYINFGFSIDWHILPDFVLLLLGMDLAMYIFHYGIHHSVVYKAIHRFHHHYNDPIPIDLFVLHPLETISFGGLWLVIIALYNFNFYAVMIYLFMNVVFGIAGHLGIEPVPDSIRNSAIFRYLGTSSFHHQHHTDINYNFGFYTSIWDRMFGTYKS